MTSTQQADNTPPETKAASSRLFAYLRRLPLTETERLERTLATVRDLPSDSPEPGADAMQRLFAEGIGPDPGSWPCAMPDIERASMAPEHWDSRSWRARLSRKRLDQPWVRSSRRRRMMLLLVIFCLTAVASWRMATVLPHQGSTVLEMVLVAVFAILFAWISLGFWTAMAGIGVLLRGTDRFTITKPGQADKEPRKNVRTAIVFPVYNEDMYMVCAGIEAVYRSIERTGRLAEYDVYILSDTQNPDAWIEEEAAWARLVRRLDAEWRVFYRRRRSNIKKKSGNVADFCRRWGKNYEYMAVLDADSVMSGETLNRMVDLMERKRTVGILQSLPAGTGQRTFIGRVQQFAARLYGPVFTAGLHYWLLGDAPYWGHNALIRMRPFIRHCALGRLPGKPPMGGEIMSHDFVESALMRRAGFEVWLAYDLEGSYEKGPPNLLSEMIRDRRWCKGNLQHLRLIFTRGIFSAHRALFLNGIMAYGSALLWFLFLAVSSAEAIVEAFTPPTYFPDTKSLFPHWPNWEPWWALSLLATTGVLLFLPKLLVFLLVVIKGRTRSYGGFFRLPVSIFIEIITSTLLAPTRMLFHSKFVFLTLLGRETHWHTQQREDEPTTWREAFRSHIGGTFLALLWGGALFLLNRDFFWWISPIFIPVVLSIPISVWTSKPGLGRAMYRLGLLKTPEEMNQPRELAETEAAYKRNRAAKRPLSTPKGNGFTLAVLDPDTCALHLRQLNNRRSVAPSVRAEREEFIDKAVEQGPESLTPFQKRALLYDAQALRDLHRKVWTLPHDRLAAHWSDAIE
ncbi:glucans biosynthesis glucosyltransferase MdoH [Oceanidesulfovibrio indonesiensis]|uniref:Glucans biosynthesis glucosyltransferase H n=1 Tax=Oceanidesulfovibrio indonesiensis TaxID=54767 RepID=A0A7M3MJV3_9BACT|nr:glucans biosynthesis glucosyltransferase MdoH [Oceanidesulfovibrio indonesiensis]TVM19960.1 glucans biosynthesis glucosyltransferase MdoH [Oceanidesulfovibrio indonesiensis]